MAVLTRDALLEMFRRRVGDGTSDEDLQDIEDFNDTIASFESGSGEDWKRKYEENDNAWRKRYRDRFFGGGDPKDREIPPEINKPEPTPEEVAESITVDDLFTEV